MYYYHTMIYNADRVSYGGGGFAPPSLENSLHTYAQCICTMHMYNVYVQYHHAFYSGAPIIWTQRMWRISEVSTFQGLVIWHGCSLSLKSIM